MSLPQYKQVAPGVLSIQALDIQSCNSIIHNAEENGDWIQAEITNYDDKKTLSQYVDLEARNVQVKGPLQIPNLCMQCSKIMNQVGLPTILTHWNISGLKLSGIQLAKYVAGSHIRNHNDTATEFSSRCVSAILYLNDNYEGGTLNFPRSSYSHHPNVGELLLFPSEYLHGVFPVILGIRYCFVGFFLVNDNSY
ncbi:2OG-Fe(II) oxygenase [Acinetobacter seifertii]|uniref:2OG-Fe(II) oxygenase n=1 Tax=Acinetobacter seifertii TaxID=1530123 RepID=UPI00280F658D|nr:2OG-Fe(II) oxygenase [Acinetobacter seifertii]MDQ9038307.1 2OG-Fe(II) oxygenase [Acinetobacter seifertii]